MFNAAAGSEQALPCLPKLEDHPNLLDTMMRIETRRVSSCDGGLIATPLHHVLKLAQTRLLIDALSELAGGAILTPESLDTSPKDISGLPVHFYHTS